MCVCAGVGEGGKDFFLGDCLGLFMVALERKHFFFRNQRTPGRIIITQVLSHQPNLQYRVIANLRTIVLGSICPPKHTKEINLT